MKPEPIKSKKVIGVDSEEIAVTSTGDKWDEKIKNARDKFSQVRTSPKKSFARHKSDSRDVGER